VSHIGTHTATLLLEDGTVYKGKAYGIKSTTSGEICFNTGMTGYQEVFTDPSYYNQILVTTNAHIGNYGTKAADTESKGVQIAGLICKNFSIDYHRPLADQSIQEYFEQESLVCISDIDTREIVKRIRDKGAMNAVISSEHQDISVLEKILKETPSMEGLELASKVSTKEAYYLGNPEEEYKVAVLDFGTKTNILNCIAERGAYLKVFPAKTDFETIAAWNPDGFFLSNGPGDPSSMEYAIETTKKILETNKPTFGICLGHQILSLAQGVSTYKMHNGHRGANHPVINLDTGKCEITTQNHGFAVSKEELEAKSDTIKVTHKNLNDDTIEGIEIIGKPAFSVQHHPEANPGPHDSRYLFDKFISLIKNHK
jgi:carbamoyl-phosphate synthase small subunit